MRHPAYHLRTNKAVDRFLLLRVLDGLSSYFDISRHTYYGMSGPFLEDIRVLCQRFPSMRFVSIERNEATFKRQQFHRNTRNLTLLRKDVNSFIKQDLDGEKPCVMWLDYTDFSPARVSEFASVLDTVSEHSVVKVTVRADIDLSPIYAARRLLEAEDARQIEASFLEEFQRKYDRYLARKVTVSDLEPPNLRPLLMSMFEIAAQQALPARSGTVYLPVHSCWYSDGTKMLSITGIVCKSGNAEKLASHFQKVCKFSNVTWYEPEQIDMPELSMKERLKLERLLPASRPKAKTLQKVLGYKIDSSSEASERKLKQYQQYYQDYPLFGKLSF